MSDQLNSNEFDTFLCDCQKSQIKTDRACSFLCGTNKPYSVSGQYAIRYHIRLLNISIKQFEQ